MARGSRLVSSGSWWCVATVCGDGWCAVLHSIVFYVAALAGRHGVFRGRRWRRRELVRVRAASTAAPHRRGAAAATVTRARTSGVTRRPPTRAERTAARRPLAVSRSFSPPPPRRPVVSA